MAEAFPFTPNRVGQPITVRREWRTEILTSRAGREQRRSLRDQPRWSVEFPLTVTDDCRRALDRVLTFGQRQAWDLAERPGVWPALTVRLAASLSARRATPAGVLEAVIQADVEPGSLADEDEGAAAATFDGREVLLIQPDRGQPVTMDAVQPRERIDPGFGAFADFHPVGFAQRLWSAQYTGCDAARIAALRAFTARQKGQRGEFWMPTFTADLVPSAGAAAAADSILVEGAEIAADFAGDPVHQALAVRLADGSWLFRIITDLTPAGADTLVTVSAAWGVTVPATARLSWLHLRRLASDIVEETWTGSRAAGGGNPSAAVTLPMVTLEVLAAE